MKLKLIQQDVPETLEFCEVGDIVKWGGADGPCVVCASNLGKILIPIFDTGGGINKKDTPVEYLGRLEYTDE